MEVDSPVQERLIHEYWTPPAENWLEYFMKNEKLEDILKKPKENKELLGKLATQFAEQACIAEREELNIQSKNFPSEDFLYYQRKGACLWLCSMACAAAIDWDVNYLLDKFDFLTVRPLVEYTRRMYHKAESPLEMSFGEWLWYKFFHATLMQNRVPIPVPKPTVNNPQIKTSPDQMLVRYENNQRAMQELLANTSTYLQFLESLVRRPVPLTVPGWRCFYEPFKEGAAKSLNIGISGEDILVSGAPKPITRSDMETIAANELANMANFEMLQYYFDEASMTKKCIDLIKLIAYTGRHVLSRVDYNIVEGYKIAFGLVAPKSEQIPQEKEFDEDNSDRNLGIKRLRQEAEIADNKKLMSQVSNMACDLIQQQPVLIRQMLEEKTCRPFIQALQSRMNRITKEIDRRRIFALLHYFCATVPGFKEILEGLGFPREWLRDMVSLPSKPPFQMAQKHIIQALVAGNVMHPFWTMLTSFNIADIRAAVDTLTHQGATFKVPARFRYSELLQDFIGNSSRSIIEINAVLIAKATQLANLQSFVEWEQYCNQLPAFFGPERLSINLLKFAMHVKNFTYNRKLHTSWEVVDLQQYNVHLATAKRLFNDSCLTHSNVTREALAFFLNAKEFEYIVKLDIDNFLITFSKLLAAFGTRGGNTEGMNEFLKLWVDKIKPFFERPIITRGRNDQLIQRERENTKQRTEFIKFIRLIKEPGVSSFLISFLTHLFNKLLEYDKKPQLKIFVQNPSVFPNDFEFTNPNNEAVVECLTEVLRIGIECNPCNGFFLRKAADLKYVHGEMEDAATLYIETIIACSPNFQPPFPENVVDDTMWSRLRICLSRMSQHTVAALVCQLMKSRRHEEYGKAAAVLASNTTTDAGPECFSMIYDLALAEELSAVYDNAKQFNNMARLQQWIGKGSLNPSNRQDILMREQSRRVEQLFRYLSAYLFGTQL